jgi:hypothetical protein
LGQDEWFRIAKHGTRQMKPIELPLTFLPPSAPDSKANGAQKKQEKRELEKKKEIEKSGEQEMTVVFLILAFFDQLVAFLLVTFTFRMSLSCSSSKVWSVTTSSCLCVEQDAPSREHAP